MTLMVGGVSDMADDDMIRFSDADAGETGKKPVSPTKKMRQAEKSPRRADDKEPWKADGVSRATWFRRQKAHGGGAHA